MSRVRRTRVVVLGGGLGALSAAFHLTATRERRSRFEVRVYTQGWRLGGKGASGRNARAGQRIEEHGLHAFMGFYENTFRTMRAAYDEWEKAPDNPFRTFRDALDPLDQVTLAESPDEAGEWKAWTLRLSAAPGEPGDGAGRPTLEGHLRGLLGFIGERARGSGGDHPALEFARRLAPGHADAPLRGELLDMLDRVRRALAGTAWSALGDDVRRALTLLEVGCAAARGIVLDVLPGGGYAAIDGWDFKQWLEHHGCSSRAAWSAPVRSLYTLGFAFVEGRQGRDNARASAGVALKVALELAFGCRGAPLWRMRAGMGDTVFTPLYAVLHHQRRVPIEFFHRVKSLRLSPDGRAVDSIEVSRQVDLVPGRAAYQPLVDVPVRGGTQVLPCWPSEPDWSQVRGGAAIAERLGREGLTLESAWCPEEAGRLTLRRGVDFDHVVLGISVAELRSLTPELAAASPPWREMLDGLATVQTQAMQLWLSPDLEALGWRDGPTALTGYAEPFDTWGDMSHLLPMEAWPEDAAPRSIAYFCSPKRDPDPIPPFTDTSYPRAELRRVEELARDWVAFRLGPIWPRAVRDGGRHPLDLDLLVAPRGGTGPERFAQQWFRANVDPTERYVQSLPGTARLRLDPGASGFDNLFLAGDWTRSSLMAGCAEAAVESGMRAARALCGEPGDISGSW